MSKYILLLFSFLGSILLNYFTNEDVTIQVKAPDQVNAGENFTIEVTITKANIERFARFYQDLPIGCTATELESKNAIFTFKDQQAKFIWMPGSLPAEEMFTVSYSVQVDQTVSGKIVIPGQFVYIKNNERITVEVNPIEINVINPNGENNMVQNIDSVSTNTNNNTQNYSPQNTTLSTNRSIDINGNMAVITVKINKPDLENNFAKVEEFLPNNLQAIADKDGGSLFSFDNHTVKFLWMNVPADNEMIVSYKIMKDDASDITMDDLRGITGSFSYLDGSDTKNMAIKTEGENNNNDLANNSTNNNTNTVTQDNNQSNNIVNETNNNQTTVSYSIQICALMKQYRSPKFFNNRYYKVKDKVSLEEHEGWKKYTIRKFPVYKEARDYRVKIWNSTPIKDAFVAAYNNGQRITVQEALMIANQQWYQ